MRMSERLHVIREANRRSRLSDIEEEARVGGKNEKRNKYASIIAFECAKYA